jgi:hypothetical protein
MKHYSPTGRRNHDRLLKRLLDTWDRNGSTSGPTPWQIYDDYDDDGNFSSPGHEISRILWYPLIHYHIRNTPHLSLCWVR